MSNPYLQHKKKDAELWITNISRNHDVSLSDLRLTVRRGQSINLFNKRHFHYTEEQIRKSIESGSIYKKSNFIKIREIPPVIINMRIDIADHRLGIIPLRKFVSLEKVEYEDLDFQDENLSKEDMEKAEEQYAIMNADMDLIDQTPALPVDPKFINKN